MTKKTALILTALCLSGCTTALLPPEPQQMQVQKIDKTAQKTAAARYLCKNDKQVRVVKTQSKRNKKRNLQTVSVTFNEITEKLTRSVSEQGEAYDNIRWRWIVKDGVGTLTGSTGVLLAEQCMPQQPNES